jgi:uncharacterized membrane protein (DUF373 family)
MDQDRDRAIRDRTESTFGYVEDVFYIAVALALMVAGAMLFFYSLWSFASSLGDEEFTTTMLALLDSLLLVFIVTELIHTVRAVIDQRILVAEPFLIVGIVAAIRRLVVVSAEAKELLGTPDFADAMLEIGVLTAGVVLLGLTVFLLRHTQSSEPTSAHEPRSDD